jgi:hypothetical protein
MRTLKIRATKIVALFFVLAFNYGVNATSKIEMVFSCSPDSSGLATPVSEGLKFSKVNGTGVAFYTAEIANNDRYSKSFAEVPQNLLKVGSNQISVSVHWQGLETMARGYCDISFTLINSDSARKTVVSGRVGQGQTAEFLHNVNINLSLQEIDPVAYREIQRLKIVVEQYKKELENVENIQPTLDELRQTLDDYSKLDFDSLNPDDVRKISKEFEPVAEMIEAYKQDIEEIRQEIIADLEESRTEIEKNQETTLEQIKNSGIDIENSNFFEVGPVTDFPTPEINYPEMESDTGDPANGYPGYYYRRLAEDFKSKINFANESGKTQELLALYWKSLEIFESLGAQLSFRARTAKIEEIRGFNDASKILADTYALYFDEYGFLKNLKVPSNLKRFIAKELRQSVSDYSKKIQNLIANLDPQEIERNQDELNAYSELVNGLATSPNSAQGVEIRRQLGRAVYASLSTQSSEIKSEALGGAILVKAADIAQSEGKTAESTSLLKQGARILDFALGFVPVASAINDGLQIICGLATGYDYTGEKMDGLDYTFRAASMAIGIFGGKAIVRWGTLEINESLQTGAQLIRKSNKSKDWALALKSLGKDSPEALRFLGATLKNVPEAQLQKLEIDRLVKLMERSKNVKQLSAETANARFLSENIGHYPPYLENSLLASVELTENFKLWRVHGGGAPAQGRWIISEDPRTVSKEVIRNLYSIPPDNLLTHFVEVNIPKGTRIQFGVAAPIKELGLKGGGLQWQLMSRVEDGWGVPVEWK